MQSHKKIFAMSHFGITAGKAKEEKRKWLEKSKPTIIRFLPAKSRKGPIGLSQAQTR